MACAPGVEYISTHERRGQRGRPKGSQYKYEHKRHLRKAALTYDYNNHENCTLQQQLSKTSIRQAKNE